MLVKIVALGLSPAIWKNVFHHLRNSLPDHPFAAGIFSSAGELAYLTREFFPHQWRREAVDFVLCEPASGADWNKRLAFLRKLNGDSQPPVALVLTLSALEHGIKQLIQSSPPVELHLDNQARFTVSDPALIIRNFPREFPRIRVNEHITTLRLRRADVAGRDLTPSAVRPGVVLGFSEIETILHNGEALGPDEWLKATLRAEKARLPRSGSPGLLREPKGLYLCPGLPASRVTGATVGGVTFPLLLDLGQLSEESPQFCAVRDALRKAGNRHKRRWREIGERIHVAESKTDMPVVCAGGLALVRETFAERLRARGFQRCSTLAEPAEGTFREPALLLLVGPTQREGFGAQVEEPHLVPLQEELLAPLRPLDGLLDWRALPYRSIPAGGPRLTAAVLREQVEELSLRERKAAEGANIADNRGLMLEQELHVLGTAQERLAELLEAREALQVWTGSLPRDVRQVLVFSHDQEEAGAVLQALVGVSRKRWFDLSPFTDADALRNLSLEHVQHYLSGGMMVITAASREKLRKLQVQIAERTAEVTGGLAECHSAQRFYGDESGKIEAAQEALARQWVRDALDDWLDEQFPALLERLEVLRRRHERRWFSRALVNRVAVVPSSAENRPALLAACRELYPGFNEEHSRTVHVDYEPQDELTPAEKKALRDAEGASPSPPEAFQVKLQAALAERNRRQFAAYLGVIAGELEQMRVDLVVIEQRRETAFAILEHLRRTLPALAETPAILILPEYWAPGPGEGLPWPRTRVLCLRRLGPLTAEDCSRHLRALYSA
jgi:hypothetical protein